MTLALLTALGSASANLTAAPPVVRASVTSAGAQAGADSTRPAISADGRFIAFVSGAANLAPGGTPDITEVFVRDRQTGTTELVSVATGGTRGNADSDSPAISADGRLIAFRSYATNLVADDTNGAEDIFLRDRQAHTTVRLSTDAAGAQANGWSDTPALSADGAFAAFASAATNLVPGDTNSVRDIFVKDIRTGQVARVSLAADGSQANGSSFAPVLNADAHFVAFHSFASNLVAGDTNNAADVFVVDRLTLKPELSSKATDGTPANTDSDDAGISGDGQWVSFRSYATNLGVPVFVAPQVYLHNRQTGQTALVSVAMDGSAGNGESDGPVLSADGRYIAFWSKAGNLVAGDANAWEDVFVRDRVAATTTRVSLSAAGAATDLWSLWPSMTPDSLYVAFESTATDLVTGDTNAVSDAFVAGPRVLPIVLGDVGRALRIAGGLTMGLSLDLPRLDVVAATPSTSRIDLMDAARLVRQAAGLDP